MKVCPICWNEEKEKECIHDSKECVHDREDYIEIDDNIFDIIVMLNKKGYHTKYCCGGHDRLSDEVYIVFDKWNSHNIINKLDVKKDIGIYWKLTKSNCAIRALVPKDTKTETEAKHFLSNRRNELREWVKKL